MLKLVSHGTVNRIRTYDPQLRRLLLYPTELLRHVLNKARLKIVINIIVLILIAVSAFVDCGLYAQ